MPQIKLLKMHSNLIGSCNPGKVYLIPRGGEQGWMQRAAGEESAGEFLVGKGILGSV